MPLIPKPNYNQIFASQAPDQDKPAVFNNYPEGWGPESRPNNGKPTIKGFNYLQQTSDLKDLWILQNGACLPYDESIEYAEGAPVLKDGVIQYKTASGFSPAIAEKPYILNYFTEGTSYPINARIALENGDIVKSTVANNTANPNVDMTGWENFELNTKHIKYANLRDLREWGVVPDQTTDYTALIRDIVQNQLDSYEVLYIPFGVRWNYSGIYSYLKDYQTIVDDSGRDEARKLWQSTRVTWHKTNANTGATNGNTETIAGDYHPAYVVDTYGTSGTVAARASTVYRLGGSSKWQTGMDATTVASHFSIAQYGSFVDGTKSFTIGHQDGTVAGRFGFNHALTTSSMLYNFGKASYLDETTPFTVQFLQSSSSTADFQQYFRYGATTAYREDIKVDGTHSVVTKNSRRITTTADCVRYGTRKNVKAPTSSILLTADESSSFITNIGSSVAFTASLPKAAIGLSFEFSVDAAFGLRVQPNAADNFVGLAVGKYKESPTVGNKLKIVAVTASTWSFEQIGTWTDQT